MAISAGSHMLAGLKSDGTLVLTGDEDYDVSGWKLFDSLDELDAWLTAEEDRQRELRRQAATSPWISPPNPVSEQTGTRSTLFCGSLLPP